VPLVREAGFTWRQNTRQVARISRSAHPRCKICRPSRYRWFTFTHLLTPPTAFFRLNSSAVDCRVTSSLHMGPATRRAHASVTAVDYRAILLSWGLGFLAGLLGTWEHERTVIERACPTLPAWTVICSSLRI